MITNYNIIFHLHYNYTFAHLKRRLGQIKKQKYNGEFHTLPYLSS